MPFYKEININEQTTAYFWKISEDLDWFFDAIQLSKKSMSRLETMNSIEHKKGFLAVRMLLQYNGFTDFDLYYDSARNVLGFYYELIRIRYGVTMILLLVS